MEENPKQRHQCTNLTVESSNQCFHASIDEQFDKALKWKGEKNQDPKTTSDSQYM